MRHIGSSQLLCVLVCVLGSEFAAIGCSQTVTPCLGDECPGPGGPAAPSPGASSFESDLPSSSQQSAGGGAKGESAHDASGTIGAAPPMAPQASTPSGAPTRGAATS